MAETAFDFKKFIDETKATLLTPADYFSVMSKTGGFAEPLIKALIYGAVAVLIDLIFAIMNLKPFSDFLSGLFGYGFGFGISGILYLWKIFLSMLFYIFGLFISGAIILVISAICEGNTEYEANLRVSASLMVLAPVHALFGIFYKIDVVLGSIIGIVVILYGFWMLYHALIKSLGGKTVTAKIISIILSIVPVLVILSSLVCAQLFSNIFENKNNTFPEQMMKNVPMEDQEQMKKALEEATKGLEMMNKEIEEEKKEAEK